jgi:hypothetical protein
VIRTRNGVVDERSSLVLEAILILAGDLSCTKRKISLHKRARDTEADSKFE